MKNQIIKLGEKSYKVLGFNEEQIILSSKNHYTFDSLKDSTKKSGMLESIRIIPIVEVSELFYNEKYESFSIRYNKDGKLKKQIVQLADNSFRESIVTSIAELKTFQKNVIEESKIKPLVLNLIGLVAIIPFIWVFRGMAIDSQNGEHYVASGRKSGLKQLLANAVEFIGPIGIIVIGALGFIYLIYRTYKRYITPALEIKYS